MSFILGLVSIPVNCIRLSKTTTFALSFAKQKVRVPRQNRLSARSAEVVIRARRKSVRGYEVSKGQYVRVEDAELEALEAEANSSIDMREFIPI